MSEQLKVSSSPHIRSKETTGNIMLWVIIALLPATFFGIYNFRDTHAWLLVIVTTAAAVLTEYIYEKLMHKKITIKDYSAAVTGLLLALNLPPTAPIWMGIIGSVFAILVVKQLFGGLGQNFMNPALGARCFLLISFTGRMTSFVYDGVSGATPLATIRANIEAGNAALDGVNSMDMLLGNIAGTIGETSVIAIVIGAIILILKGIIDLRIPGTYIVTFALFIGIFGGFVDGVGFFNVQYMTSRTLRWWSDAWSMVYGNRLCNFPITKKGQIVYGYPSWMSDRSFSRLFGRFSRRGILCDLSSVTFLYR